MSTHDGALTLGALAESAVLALVESVVMSTQSPSAPPLEPKQRLLVRYRLHLWGREGAVVSMCMLTASPRRERLHLWRMACRNQAQSGYYGSTCGGGGGDAAAVADGAAAATSAATGDDLDEPPSPSKLGCRWPKLEVEGPPSPPPTASPLMTLLIFSGPLWKTKWKSAVASR